MIYTSVISGVIIISGSIISGSTIVICGRVLLVVVLVVGGMNGVLIPIDPPIDSPLGMCSRFARVLNSGGVVSWFNNRCGRPSHEKKGKQNIGETRTKKHKKTCSVQS
jgi:hypothetical protein